MNPVRSRVRIWGTFAFILIRFGLLAFVMCFVFAIATGFQGATDFSAWYAGRTIFVLLSLAAPACFGFYTSLAGQPLFSKDLLEDQPEAM